MVTLLRDILPFDLFKQMLDDGHIRSQVHPLYPELLIFNYTESAQFDRVWNAATNVCRGLIVVLEGPDHKLTDTCVVLARPFNKFHNLNTEYVPETLEANLPTDKPPLVTQKLDGSMGVLYEWDNKLWIATRGSFDSDQARWATEWLRAHVAGWVYDPEPHYDCTPVFEIIYQKNRIVVDYDFEGLVLLSLVGIANGMELHPNRIAAFAASNKFKMVKVFDKTLAECAAEDNSNEEGYVLTYSNGVKVKVKFAEYVRLHRILTGLNPKTVWEMLSLGQNDAIDKLLNDPKMPESFINWLREVATGLKVKYHQFEREAQAVFAGTPHRSEGVAALSPTECGECGATMLRDAEKAAARKANALYFKQTPHLSSVLFAMLDGKDYAPIIWDRIKPKIVKTFVKEGE